MATQPGEYELIKDYITEINAYVGQVQKWYTNINWEMETQLEETLKRQPLKLKY